MNSPIFLFYFGGSVGAAFSILVGDVAALFIGGVLVLQDVLDAELQALQAGLGAGPLGEGAGLGLLGAASLGHPTPARRQNMDSYPVHH